MTVQDSFSPQEYAIFRHVWSLGIDRDKLDSFFLMRGRIAFVCARMDKSSHAFKILLPYRGVDYEVECLDCSIRYLESIPAGMAQKIPLLLSFRRAEKQRLSIVLLKLPHRKEWGQINERFEEYM